MSTYLIENFEHDSSHEARAAVKGSVLTQLRNGVDTYATIEGAFFAHVEWLMETKDVPWYQAVSMVCEAMVQMVHIGHDIRRNAAHSCADCQAVYGLPKNPAAVPFTPIGPAA